MSNQWLRLWHDMPNDPKWRTVARHSKQPISLVMAVYLHLLVCASRNVTRGHADVTVEDLASALDCDDEQIQAVLDAMQGRVLDGMHLSGWEMRQPKREEYTDGESSAKSPAQRKREQREREKLASGSLMSRYVTAMSRDVTTDKDKDKDKDIEEANASLSPAELDDPGRPAESLDDEDLDDEGGRLPACPHRELIDLFGKQLPQLAQPKPELWAGKNADAMRARWRWVLTAKKPSGKRYATNREEALDFFDRFFGYVATCPHLVGQNSRGWEATLAWLVTAGNFTKVVEGNYAPRAEEVAA